jgi:hypothetical protein
VINRLFIAYVFWLISGLALLLVAAPAFASDPPITQYSYYTFGSNQLSFTNSLSDAVNQQVVYYNADTTSEYTWSLNSMSGNNALILGYCKGVSNSCSKAGVQRTSVTYTPTTRLWCVASNVAPTNGVCPTVTPPPNLCVKGTTETVSYDITVSGTGASKVTNGTPLKGGSDGQCEVDVTDVIACYQRKDGSNYCTYKMTMTGAQKNPDVTQKIPAPTTGTAAGAPVDSRNNVPPLAASNCPGGTVQAGVDPSGIPICAGTGTLPSTPTAAPTKSVAPPVTVTNSDGSKTTTTTTTQTNSDGSKTVTNDVVTVAPDGTSTKTQAVSVTPNTAGNAGTTDKNPDQVDFCKANPTLSVCQTSSVAGACASTTCTGDAIQCATLRAAATMQCAMKDDVDAMKAAPSYSLGSSLMNNSDPMQSQIDAQKKGTMVDLSDPKIDQNGFLGGGACLADKTFSVMGRTTTFSFSSICQKIQPIRYVMLTIGFLLAYLIVSRSVLRG